MTTTTEKPDSQKPEGAKPAAGEKPAAARKRLTSAEVRDYLMTHPGFLARNPDVLEHQSLPPRSDADGEKVVDFQRALVDRLRRDNDRLRVFQSEVITAARANVSAQALVHEAVLMLMEATSFEQLIHTITQDLAPAIGIDVVTLCVESEEPWSDTPAVRNLHLLPPGAIDMVMGEGVGARLVAGEIDDGAIFGPAATLVRSQALARLDLGEDGPVGLLALGSRDAEKYEEGQGGELLGFLALAVERMIQLWLRQSH
ncbi:DUF484 family protein [Zavarzinia compransoris]|uniref:DUF484 family protein n=1 Tax=Zavarzinia marina TaxID=2911065 RepID=UPI001F395E37|nr:DUF484 family protein [Zavarzinia marina]MCF4165672.1 DUF484 family protein [Zavarzinia marina]